MLTELLVKIKGIYEDGIESNPGYALGDRIRMMLTTKRDIDNLPDTTNTEGNDSA
jgi:hypothetical protein